MEKLYIIIPTYNEQDNIENLIYDWYPIVDGLSDAHFIVIDDGSKDKTLDKLTELAAIRPKIEILTKENGGHGDTLLFGYQYAIDQNADWIFQTDSDGQTNASEFHLFWNAREHYDAILGYRPKRGDGIARKIVEDILCLILRIIFGIKVPDANCPFRLMKADKVSKYISKLPKHYFLPNVMLTVFFVKRDRVKFQAISFNNRQGGKGSLNIRKIIKIGFQSVQDFIKLRKTMN